MGRNRSPIAIIRAALASIVLGAACAHAQPDDAGALLQRADDLKTADNAAFLRIVRTLEPRAATLDALQRQWLRYLQAWQRGYAGDVEGALPQLKALAVEANDPALRFRALVSLVNEEALVAHYLDAYIDLDALLEMQPQVADARTRMLGYAVAALLYNQAGQYDLGIAKAERWLAEDASDAAQCKGTYLKLDGMFRSATLAADDPQAARGIQTCLRTGEPLYAGLIRTFVANTLIAQQRTTEAIAVLEAGEAEAPRTNSTRLSAEFHSILARAHFLAGHPDDARREARSAIESSISGESSKPVVDAYEVLANLAKAQGDFRAALAYHEQYTLADKRYLGDTSAQALAYQMVSQQVDARKRELDRLHERNQVLQLQQQVSARSEEAERLYILLLLLVIAFITLWTYRIKRSQVRFQKLARRDGLTGIVNRQHFMDQSKTLLTAAARAGREICLILVDLDNFKNVNDTHGHVAGDGVLKQTVEMCQLHMRAADLFGRLGGEEFGVLLPDCALETARERAEELRAAIATFAQAGVEVTVSASFGVASTRSSGYDLRQMLIHADSALYRAKRHGRNRVEAFAADAAAAGA